MWSKKATRGILVVLELFYNFDCGGGYTNYTSEKHCLELNTHTATQKSPNKLGHLNQIGGLYQCQYHRCSIVLQHIAIWES